ncbi:glucosaminidase domain-containing protein [Acetobacter syzygii]|nr:glucosaminidase domain-containing protein [Acetobacter syzygii]GAN72046.1 hypothetical protein Absy_027_144 [Acetobacter syzygii]GBR64245.1 hypothetical protein AA0483_1268 [Acetobacter syzygii NRIC 0483]GEL55265.1 hypothetical protein ASY01nite_03310 [Acetobacter syzygii]
MSLSRPVRITASVGKGGTNRRDDVRAIQELLNSNLPKYTPRLRVDGLCGFRTFEAIRKIQQNLVGMSSPDGRIDPRGPTWRLLNESKLSSSVNRVTTLSGVNAKSSIANSSIPTTVIQAAQAAQRKWKVPASVTIAQWMLESGSGKRMPSHSHNPFGIKAGRGQSFVMAGTHEETKDHKLVAIMAPFRVFSSMNEAFDQHGRLLATHPAYKLARQHTGDPDAYANALTYHYATKSGYGTLLISYMKKYDLYKYNK